jgi:hypothetical protein
METMTYGHPEDLAVIDAYMRTAATRAVADAIRAAQPALVDNRPHYAIAAVDHWQQPELDTLSAPQSSRERVQQVTVRPVAGEPLSARTSWLQRYWPQLACGLVLAAALGVGAWLLVLAIAAAIAALVAALTALLPILACVVVVLLVLALCGRGGGGKTFSGTFQGKIH